MRAEGCVKGSGSPYTSNQGEELDSRIGACIRIIERIHSHTVCLELGRMEEFQAKV